MKEQSRINRKKQKENSVQVCVEVEFMPFPSKEARHEAYRTHAKLFLRAKERIVRECVLQKKRS